MDSLYFNHSEFMSKCKSLTAKQNQKFPFHFFFRFAVEGWGEETRGKCKEIFWSLHTRVRERVRGALVRFTTQSERTRQFQATTRSARAISSSHQDSARNAFELCPIHTAKKRNQKKRTKRTRQGETICLGEWICLASADFPTAGGNRGGMRAGFQTGGSWKFGG
jgi:hypothetical protein